MPRDRDGSFTPVTVRKRQRRLGDVDTVVLSLVAKGLTTGCSPRWPGGWHGRWSRSTPRCSSTRSPDGYVKVPDGQVANRPFYAAIGVDLAGHKDVLGLWAGTGGGESAKFSLQVLTELKNRGVADVFFLVCDGLKGLPDSVAAVLPRTTVQTCLIPLIRNTFRYASKKYWQQIATDLKPIYRARPGEVA